MKITDLIVLLPSVTNVWTLAALIAVLLFLYATRKRE
jgi:hypothetical protein